MLLHNFLQRLPPEFQWARSLWRRFPVGSLELRVRYGISARPNYAYGVYTAADLAVRLGIPAISVLEFGVAGGRGLLALEGIAEEVSRARGVKIAVYGFDSGQGMPAPVDYRDLPHVWERGFFKMDQAALKASLKHATLVLGEVANTVPGFLGTPDLPPIRFRRFRSRTITAPPKPLLQIFEGAAPIAPAAPHFCYFDDILWPEIACHNEYMGELCAIREFNAEHPHKKLPQPSICFPTHMMPYPSDWNKQIYVMHDFQHPLYCVNITPKSPRHTPELPLSESRVRQKTRSNLVNHL